MSRGLAAAAATVGVVLAACGSKQDSVEAAQPATAAAAAAAAAAVSTPAAAAPHGAAASASSPRGVVRIEGFRTPRSMLHDPDADVYLVSNVHGDPSAADDDDNGFISRVSPDGALLELKWIDGERDDTKLSAPMGMALAAGLLWVADRKTVHTFDAKTGAPRKSYELPGAKALADVAAFDGAVLVSDSGPESAPGTLYRISTRTGRISRFLRRSADDRDARADRVDRAVVGHPHGLAAAPDGSLWVTSDREVYVVRHGERRGHAELPAEVLDGILALPDGDLLVASHDGIIFRGSLLPGAPAGRGARGRDPVLPFVWTHAFTGLTTPSDIGFDARRHRVLIPLILENAVELRDLMSP